ncbi:MAG: hydroxymethylbilane synthase, partial [Alphaproteobacteria bacterium]
MAPPRSLRIGTRGSPLALAQTREVHERLSRAHPQLAEPGAIETRIIRTSGDKVTDRALAEIGGKGLFTKEIEEALLAFEIDLAVHSMKDVPTWLPPGLEIVCLLAREDPRDAFFAPGVSAISGLPEGAKVGTASLRRQAQILAQRPDVRVVTFRGNVQTRLRKLAEGQVDATVLALAGLKRLGLTDAPAAILSTEEMLPAVGQGAIGIECRSADERVRTLLAALNDEATRIRVTAERALLGALDGSCRTPIAALAEMEGQDRLHLRALLALPDGSKLFRAERRGPASDAET